MCVCVSHRYGGVYIVYRALNIRVIFDTKNAI